ncbi:MAG: SIP domain-containing protein, partial [Nonomuraea sp.]|nr:SIP domain-containing protein [Nonomuraea sp.]
MARGYAGVMMKTLGAVEHTLTVAGVEDVTPHYRRITFDAPTLFDGQAIEPAAWVRLWAPSDSGKEHQRGYTLVDPDPERERVVLEFVLHEPAGPACVWAGKAEPGDTIQVTRWASGHFAVPDPEPAGYLLVGDAASVPGVNAILAAVPAGAPVLVLLERHRDDDPLIPITPHPLAEVRWVDDVAAAVESRDWSDWYAWVTAESGATKRVKARLKELGFPAADVKARAYWIRGKAMGVERPAAEPPVAEPTVEAPRGEWRSR